MLVDVHGSGIEGLEILKELLVELLVLTKALVFLIQAGIGTCQLMSWNRVWIGGADCTGPCNGLMVKTPSFVGSGADESIGCSARQWSTGESCSSHASSWLPSAALSDHRGSCEGLKENRLQPQAFCNT